MALPHCQIVVLRSWTQLISSYSSIRAFSTTEKVLASGSRHFKLAVIGGGCGGSAVSSTFASKFGQKNVAVIEPHEVHYYQPYWTLVGGGIKKLENSSRPMGKILKSSTWIKDEVVEFQPSKNSLVLGSGETISYDYLVVAAGVVHRYDKIKGLKEALEHYPEVSTNYDPRYVEKTFKNIQNFKEGTALFTLNLPLKCPGAPAKIMYLAEDYFRRHGKRNKAKIIFNTAMGAMLGAPKYATAMYDICKQRDVEVHFLTKLNEIIPKEKVAIFEVTDKTFKPTGEKISVKYDMLHVGPPFAPPEAISKCKELSDKGGWLCVDKHTLQNPNFPNVFGIGDCTNLPNAKTAAAVASASKVLKRNLRAHMDGKPLPARYDGYSSCPLLTSYNAGILAEFDYNWEPLETFPINQAKERRLFYYFKTDLIPAIYWWGLVKGLWEGPGVFRKLLHLGFSK